VEAAGGLFAAVGTPLPVAACVRLPKGPALVAEHASGPPRPCCEASKSVVSSWQRSTNNNNNNNNNKAVDQSIFFLLSSFWIEDCRMVALFWSHNCYLFLIQLLRSTKLDKKMKCRAFT
jgi:hypothetical protein